VDGVHPLVHLELKGSREEVAQLFPFVDEKWQGRFAFEGISRR